MTSLSGLSIGIDQASPSSIGRRMEYPLVEQTPPTPTSPSNLIGVDSPPASPLRLPERILEKRVDRLGSLDDSLTTPRSVSGEGLGSFAMPIPTPRSRKVDSIQKESPEKQEGQEQSDETRITIGSAQTTGCKGSCGVKPECGWRQICILPTAVISVCGGGYAYFGMGNPAFAAVLLIGSLFSGGAYFCWGREAQNADMAKLAKKLGKRSKSLGEDRAKIARIASGLSKSTEGVELATRSLSLQSRHLEGQEEVLIKNANELAERVRGE